MSNKLQIINEQEVLGKDFKMYGTFEEPLFLAKDVANWIEHSNLTMMLKSVDEDEKVISRTKDSLGRENTASFLTENGLYEVLMQSRKPIAKQFKSKVKEILKELRIGKVKIVPTRPEKEVQLERAQLLRDLIPYTPIEKYKQILAAYASKEISGQFLLPLPEAPKETYSATQLALEFGVSPNKIGAIAKANNIKNEENGEWIWDLTKQGKQVKSFVYNKKRSRFNQIINFLARYSLQESKRYYKGMYGGKFIPFHKGHLFCLDRAAQECDKVYLLMFINGDQELDILNKVTRIFYR